MSGRIIPLKRPPSASPESPGPWVLGEVFTRDGVDYELVIVGAIAIREVDGAKAKGKAAGGALDLLSDAGAVVGDHVLVLRPTRPA